MWALLSTEESGRESASDDRESASESACECLLQGSAIHRIGLVTAPAGTQGSRTDTAGVCCNALRPAGLSRLLLPAVEPPCTSLAAPANMTPQLISAQCIRFATND